MRATDCVSRASSHNVATGLASQMIAHHSGDPDVIAVANAWRDFDIANAGTWQGYITGETAAWQSYATQELNAWQTAFDASAAEDRNYTHAVTPGYAALIADYATAGENYVIATAPLETAWVNAFANAENAFYKAEADKFKDLDFQLLAADHTATDAETTAAHAQYSGYIPEILAWDQATIDANADFQNDVQDEVRTLMDQIANELHTRQQSEAAATKTAMDAAVPLEDDVAIDRAAQTGSSNSAILWQYASDLNAQPVSQFTSTTPTNVPPRPAILPFARRYRFT